MENRSSGGHTCDDSSCLHVSHKGGWPTVPGLPRLSDKQFVFLVFFSIIIYSISYRMCVFSVTYFYILGEKTGILLFVSCIIV